MDANELIPIAVAAKHTEKNEPFIRRGVKSGAIRGRKLGRDWFVDADEVQRLAAEYPLDQDLQAVISGAGVENVG